MTSRELKDFYRSVGALYEEERYVHRSGWGRSRRRFLKGLMRRFVVDSICADIGCGGGIYLGDMLDMGADKVLGVDISYPTLLRARGREPRAYLVCGDAEAIPLRDSSIQFLLSTEVIEHLENPEDFIREISRILTPGGIALITCPNWHRKKPMHISTGILRYFGIKQREYLHTAYTPDELEELSLNAGLKCIEKGTFEKDMRIWGRMYDMLLAFAVALLEFAGAPAGSVRVAYRIHTEVGGFIYSMLVLTGVAWLMKKIFKRGPRSYIIFQKRKS